MPKLTIDLEDAQVAALYLAASGPAKGRPTMGDAAALAREWVLQHLGVPCEACGLPREVSRDGSYQNAAGDWVSTWQLNHRLQRCSNPGCPDYASVLVLDSDGNVVHALLPQGGGVPTV